MKTKDIFDLAIKMGVEADFRSREQIEKLLEEKKKKYEKKNDNDFFDEEALKNPYLDSRIYNIGEDVEVKKVLAGIDIDPAEILIAKDLGDIDLVIGHHPVGKGLANLSDVMSLQCDVLNQYGVPINIAEGLMKEKIEEVSRNLNCKNHQRTVDSAKILGVNLMNSHTPTDNLAASFLKKKIEEADPERVGDVMRILKDIPEYRESIKIGAGPRIFAGNSERRCGKIALTEITGGAEGSPKLYEKMAQAGIGTIVGMHVSEEHRKEAEKANINLVIAGHMSSDSLGMNLFLDKLEGKGIEIVPCSGLIRISRN